MAKKQERTKQWVRTSATAIRSRPEWKEWIERLADFDRASRLNDLIDRAMVVYARHFGFPEVVPKC